MNEDELLRRLSEEVGSLDYPAAVIHQIKILMFFAAEYCINRELPNMILKSTAINALYGNIKYGDAAFYEEFPTAGSTALLPRHAQGNAERDFGNRADVFDALRQRG